ncbi:MAG: SIMPL domain-containing protein [Acetobacteraceae bacterium]|nr:SIMPL domain-containing protein [Acetobacteraceae bacterium]MBV8521567.1 SIMPL domain-containing protein [Acetobacteraceae bacterium]MBV8588755.1 SIMPL domain-containing protein [Acetobacteraceae bacterium]
MLPDLVITRSSRWTVPVTVAGLLVCAPVAGHGQRPATGGESPPSLAGHPLLHLSAVGTSKAEPDELIAGLAATGLSSSPAEAQRQVNARIRKATEVAARASGVELAVQGYSVAMTEDRPVRWMAQQTLELRAERADGEALLALVGQLQEAGLVVGQLGWQLSRQNQQHAIEAADVAALEALRSRASIAAQAMGLEVDRFQDVRLDQGTQPLPAVAFGRQASSPAIPPQSSPQAQEISAIAHADIVLKTPPPSAGR